MRDRSRDILFNLAQYVVELLSFRQTQVNPSRLDDLLYPAKLLLEVLHVSLIGLGLYYMSSPRWH